MLINLFILAEVAACASVDMARRIYWTTNDERQWRILQEITRVNEFGRSMCLTRSIETSIWNYVSISVVFVLRDRGFTDVLRDAGISGLKCTKL